MFLVVKLFELCKHNLLVTFFYFRLSLHKSSSLCLWVGDGLGMEWGWAGAKPKI